MCLITKNMYVPETRKKKKDMTNLNFITYNVRGLSSPEKRHMVLREVERYSAEIGYVGEKLR